MDPASALAALGFTETESRLYCELLRSGPATGYRLAQAVGKAPANTYQALSALARKGAVLTDDGEARTFRAAPPEELLSALQSSFDQRRHVAGAALADLATSARDDRIYELNTVAQAEERARAMIAQAREIILFDLFPGPFALLKPQLLSAARRGVTVAGLTYEQAPPGPGPVCVLAQGAAVVSHRWPGAQMSLVTDAAEMLTALLAREGGGLLRAVWSDSAYLACLQHNGLAAEIRLSAMGSGERDHLAHLSLLRAAPAGLRALIGADRPDLSEPEAAA